MLVRFQPVHMAKHLAPLSETNAMLEGSARILLIRALDHRLSAAEPDRARREMEKRLNRARARILSRGKHVRR